MRCYNPGPLINAFSLRTGNPNLIYPIANKVYVGNAFSTTSKQTCQQTCQNNPQCKSVTFNGPSSANPNKCVLNYGETGQVIDLPPNSGISSAPKYC